MRSPVNTKLDTATPWAPLSNIRPKYKPSHIMAITTRAITSLFDVAL